MAAKILARTGSISRFPSAAAYASYCGVARIEVSPGDVVRHRLSRADGRQLNYALDVMALAQIQYAGPGCSYYQTQTRRRALSPSGTSTSARWPRSATSDTAGLRPVSPARGARSPSAHNATAVPLGLHPAKSRHAHRGNWN